MQTNWSILNNYLHDVDMLLSGTDDSERELILQGLQEHVDERLSGIEKPSQGDVRAILGELGPPEAIAAEVTLGERVAASNHIDHRRSHHWPVVAIVALHLIASFALLFLLLISTSVESISGGRQVEERFFVYSWSDYMLTAAIIIFPLWLVCAALIKKRPSSIRPSAALLGLMPTVLVTVAISPTIGWHLAESSGLTVATFVTILVLVLNPILAWLTMEKIDAKTSKEASEVRPSAIHGE